MMEQAPRSTQKGSNIWTPVCSAMLNTIPGILPKGKKKMWARLCWGRGDGHWDSSHWFFCDSGRSNLLARILFLLLLCCFPGPWAMKRTIRTAKASTTTPTRNSRLGRLGSGCGRCWQSPQVAGGNSAKIDPTGWGVGLAISLET